MKTRETPREIPDKPHYWRFEDEEAGEHWFRIPFQLTALKLLKKAHADLEDVSDEEKTERTIIYSCAMIGQCWNHPTLDLETPKGDDLKAYGAGVLDELHEAGYGPMSIYRIGPALIQRMQMLAVDDAEVEARADFSEAPAATGS